MIYLDSNATTPPSSEVVEAMERALRDGWGNPGSAHAAGRRARALLEEARERVARLLGASPEEIVFTSGGTESDHAAILGVADASAALGCHVVISSIEHPAVEEGARALEARRGSVTRVPVGSDGRVDPAAVEAALREDTVLVSVMHANNETGILQPIEEISRIAKERGIPFHTDAAQSVGKIATRVDDLGVDLLTIAGHKLYGPKGIGALYVRKGTPIAPWLRGGGQEAGLRAGTEPVPGAVGLGAAAALARAEGEVRAVRMRETRDRLEASLRAAIPTLVVHGAGAPRLPNTLSCAIPGVRGADLLDRLDEVAASAGAACHADRVEPSKVLLAMGVSPALATATLRLSTGRSTTIEEVEEAARRIAEAVRG